MGHMRDFLSNSMMFDRVSALTKLLHFRKHDHYKDFGWPEPEDLDFTKLKRMYLRNSLAAAGVDKTIAKTWQEMPKLWETEKPAETPLEDEIRQRFEDLRIWQRMAETDRRSLVGRYAAFIVLVKDSKKLDQPLDRVAGGLDGLAGIVPAWEDELVVSTVVDDVSSEDYGKPLFFEFTERPLNGKTSGRKVKVHSSRVIIWSEDGTLDGRSFLEPGYNDLLDAEKIRGAGGEGFWKTSRGAPIIEAPQGTKITDVAKAMGTTVEQLKDKMNESLDSFQAGFDKGLVLGGMTATPLSINLPSPEHFFAAPVNSFAASIQMPVKILMGSQTGERASTEDSREWNQTNTSRRNNYVLPLIHQFIRLLESCGILPEMDWTIGWTDLTESTAEEKLARAEKMAAINGKSPIFLDEEIREAAGYEPLTEEQKGGLEGEDPPATDDPPPDPDDEQEDEQ